MGEMLMSGLSPSPSSCGGSTPSTKHRTHTVNRAVTDASTHVDVVALAVVGEDEVLQLDLHLLPLCFFLRRIDGRERVRSQEGWTNQTNPG